MLFLLQLLTILACLFYGASKGGIFLGLISGFGLFILVFLFKIPPGDPPIDVMLIIIAVISASSVLQVSGGLDIILQISEKILRKNAKYISIIAPLTTCFMTILCGTGHIVYTMLPIIYDISIKNNIRPERAMAASSIASQMGIIASPISVAVLFLIEQLSKYPINHKTFGLIDFLLISVPSTFLAVLVIGIFSLFRGKDLNKDKKFQKFIANEENKKYVYGNNTTLLNKTIPTKSWISLLIFILTIIIIFILGSFPSLLPEFSNKPLKMTITIQILMLCLATIIVIINDIKPINIVKSDVFRAGMVAVIAVYGVAWMADTLFGFYINDIKLFLTNVVIKHPWLFAIVLLTVSKFVNSQAVAIIALVPIVLASGVNPAYVVVFAAASYGYYILPTYPSDIAALQFDRSGTTHIGKFIINHSFILPGIIGVSSSCFFAYILFRLFFGEI